MGIQEEYNVLKKLVEKEPELNQFYGGTNWNTKVVTRRNRRGDPALQVISELKELGLKPGDYVVIGVREVDGRKAIVVIPL